MRKLEVEDGKAQVTCTTRDRGDSFLLVRKTAVVVGAVNNGCSSDNDAILPATSLAEGQRPRVLGHSIWP